MYVVVTRTTRCCEGGVAYNKCCCYFVIIVYQFVYLGLVVISGLYCGGTNWRFLSLCWAFPLLPRVVFVAGCSADCKHCAFRD